MQRKTIGYATLTAAVAFLLATNPVVVEAAGQITGAHDPVEVAGGMAAASVASRGC